MLLKLVKPELLQAEIKANTHLRKVHYKKSWLFAKIEVSV